MPSTRVVHKGWTRKVRQERDAKKHYFTAPFMPRIDFGDELDLHMCSIAATGDDELSGVQGADGLAVDPYDTDDRRVVLEPPRIKRQKASLDPDLPAGEWTLKF